MATPPRGQLTLDRSGTPDLGAGLAPVGGHPRCVFHGEQIARAIAARVRVIAPLAPRYAHVPRSPQKPQNRQCTIALEPGRAVAWHARRHPGCCRDQCCGDRSSREWPHDARPGAAAIDSDGNAGGHGQNGDVSRVRVENETGRLCCGSAFGGCVDAGTTGCSARAGARRGPLATARTRVAAACRIGSSSAR